MPLHSGFGPWQGLSAGVFELNQDRKTLGDPSVWSGLWYPPCLNITLTYASRNAVPTALLQKCKKSIERQLSIQNLQNCSSWQDVSNVLDSGFFDEESFIGSETLCFRAHKPSQLVSSTTNAAEFISLLYETQLLERACLAMDPDCTPEKAQAAGSSRAIRLAQVALRYPGAGEGGRHIDGVDRGISAPFDCLAGVALSDQTQPSAGNLVVWPGSHTVTLRQLAASSPGLKPAPSSPEEAAKQRDTIRQIVHDAAPGKGEEVFLCAGDAIIANQKLVHSGGENTTAQLRCSVYFRIKGPLSAPLSGL